MGHAGLLLHFPLFLLFLVFLLLLFLLLLLPVLFLFLFIFFLFFFSPLVLLPLLVSCAPFSSCLLFSQQVFSIQVCAALLSVSYGYMIPPFEFRVSAPMEASKVDGERSRASAHPGIQRCCWNPGTRPTKGRQRAIPDEGRHFVTLTRDRCRLRVQVLRDVPDTLYVQVRSEALAGDQTQVFLLSTLFLIRPFLSFSSSSSCRFPVFPLLFSFLLLLVLVFLGVFRAFFSFFFFLLLLLLLLHIGMLMSRP